MRQADHLPRGILLGVCVCVIVCDLEISKRGGLDPTWVVAPQKKYTLLKTYLFIPVESTMRHHSNLRYGACVNT